MNSFHTDLDEKKAEAEQLIDILNDIEDAENAITKAAILKSAFVLLLYNAIESTAFLVFERIHERVAIEHYAQLRTELRKIWVEFFFSNHPSARHHDHLEGTMRQTLQFPLIEPFMDRIKLFSGNLDARKINQLLSKYGVGALTSQNRDKLLIVKNRRNAVAHGEEMFKHACRDLSYGDLDALKSATFDALEDLVGQVESYLTEKKYLES